jgi:hypothetical protein
MWGRGGGGVMRFYRIYIKQTGVVWGPGLIKIEKGNYKKPGGVGAAL